MKAFIIAGGEGTRLRPYTYTVPKPMLNVGGKPILEYVIENLKRAGIKDITITVGYLHEKIVEYFGDGKKFGVKIEYGIERTKKGTAGSIAQFASKVNGPFVVVMGDHLTNVDIDDMVKYHQREKAMATVALYKGKVQLEYGVADVKDGKITGFREKPCLEHYYNTAIYVFQQEVFKRIKEGDDFAKDVLPGLLRDGEKVSAYILEDVWFDIGRVSDYERLDELMKAVRLGGDLRF